MLRTRRMDEQRGVPSILSFVFMTEIKHGQHMGCPGAGIEDGEALVDSAPPRRHKMYVYGIQQKPRD